MKFILRILRDTHQPILNYVWKATLLTLIPSLVISAAVMLAIPGKGPASKFLSDPVALVVCSALILAPWLETLLMWLVLSVLKRFTAKPTSIAIASAMIWGILHSLSAPTWGLTVIWPFFVFSTCFLEWEKKSKGMAIVATALVHTGQNLLPVIAVFASR